MRKSDFSTSLSNKRIFVNSHILFLEHCKDENFIIKFVSEKVSFSHLNIISVRLSWFELGTQVTWPAHHVKNLQKYYKIGFKLRIYLGYHQSPHTKPHFFTFSRDFTALFCGLPRCQYQYEIHYDCMAHFILINIVGDNNIIIINTPGSFIC